MPVTSTALGWLHLRSTLAFPLMLAAGLLSPAATASASDAPWAWPVREPRIVRGFSPPDHPWGSGHRGIDLAALPGDPVMAIGAGTVAFVGTIAGKPVVSIDHPDAGLRSTYEPVLASVRVGQQVHAGTDIGQLASSGGHCGPGCLHLGVKRTRDLPAGASTIYLDPATLMQRWAILKPVRPRPPSDGPG